MEKLQVEDIQPLRESRRDGALRPVEVALHADRGAIVQAPLPQRGQVETGERDSAEGELHAANRDCSRRRLAFGPPVSAAENRGLVAAARPIAPETEHASVRGILFCCTGGGYLGPEVEVLTVFPISAVRAVRPS